MSVEKHTSIRTAFLVYLALLGLLALTVAIAFIDLGPLNPILAVMIAVGKALLVFLFFMELRHSSQLIRLFAVAAFFWLLILVGLTLGDYLTRVWVMTIGS